MNYKIIVHTTEESAERNDGYAKDASKFYWCIVDDHDIAVQHGWSINIEEAFKQAEQYYIEHLCLPTPTSKFGT